MTALHDVVVISPETLRALIEEAGPALKRMQERFQDGKAVDAEMTVKAKINGRDHLFRLTLAIEGEEK